jgi:hypothetical protein
MPNQYTKTEQYVCKVHGPQDNPRVRKHVSGVLLRTCLLCEAGRSLTVNQRLREGPYVCKKKHGPQDDPYVYQGASGRRFRACRACMAERRNKDFKSEPRWDKPFCCKRCGATEFNLINSSRHGYLRKCRACAIKSQRATYARNSQSGQFRDRKNARTRADLRALKIEVVAAYGGKCACCGESEIDFLSIDHTLNNGKEHRDLVGAGVYRDLRRRGFPQDGFACLCMNCNFARARFGTCPHVRARAAADLGWVC